MNARTSIVRKDEIEFGLWLIFKQDGSLRMTRTQPATDRNERAMALSIKVPQSLFVTPQLRASITVEDPGVPSPVIDIGAAAAVMKQVVGCDVDIQVITPEQEEV